MYIYIYIYIHTICTHLPCPSTGLRGGEAIRGGDITPEAPFLVHRSSESIHRKKETEKTRRRYREGKRIARRGGGE